jgi:2-succinyl-5-enolpyruvyl-6-hydroxy-3-cyclohexene-1-carboxylate synthase
MFGAHVNFYHELSVPVPSLPLLRYLRQTVAHAWERTQWPFAGPVHVNAPFRDPLPPVADNTATPLREKIDEDFFALLPAPQGANTPNLESRPPAALWSEGWRGLIVVGPVQPADTADYVEAVARIAQVLRWPVLADALTPLRNHAAIAPLLVTTYDTLLRSEKLAAALKPECVLCLGGWPTSKRLREWLQQLQAPTFLLADDARNHDALHGRTQFIRSSVESFARCLGHAPAGASPWLKVWQTLHKKAEARLDAALKRQRALFEGKASWMLPWLLPPGTPVFVANSMPVRDVEYFWPANDGRHEMYFNRGANGIDGTLSTALGVAHGGRPAVLLTGDLALLHDANGFLTAPKLKGSLTVVLINNNGGGIFQHLPVARFDPPFEEFFATPQATNFAKLCAAHGVAHVAVKSWAQFARLLDKLPKQGVRVLELRTDRARDAAFRQKLFAAVAAKLK